MRPSVFVVVAPTAAVLVLALAGCGAKTQQSAQNATDSSQGSSQASSATSAAAPATSSEVAPGTSALPAKGDKPTREFVIGKWGTDGDCKLAIDLRPDGTSDGPFGNWSYADGVISFPEEPDFKVNVTIIDDKTMRSTNATSDKPSTMTRCP